MAPVKPFALDHFAQEYKYNTDFHLFDSCVAPLSMKELQSFSPGTPILDPDVSLHYAPARGTLPLREAISKLYEDSDASPDDVLVSHGAVSANYVLLRSLLAPGDHVIVQYPIFGLLIDLPEHVGVNFSYWRQRRRPRASDNEAEWYLDLKELEAMIQPNTKLIIINNPGNPTGITLSRDMLEGIKQLAEAKDITIMCDEVFRPMFHGQDHPPSFLALKYPKTIVTSSISKAYALPGLRLGWIVTSPELRKTVLQEALELSLYTTTAVGQINQQIATFALQPEVRKQILERTRSICNRNIAVLKEWAARFPKQVEYIEPAGSGTCVIRLYDKQGNEIDGLEFARRLAVEQRVSAPPTGPTFGYKPEHDSEPDLKNGLRIGVVMKEGVMEEGLKGIERLL